MWQLIGSRRRIGFPDESIRTMTAAGAAAEAALLKVNRSEDHEAVLPVIVDAFDQFVVHHCAAASSKTEDRSSGSTATPSRKLTYLPEMAATRSPGTMKPTRLSGSAAES